LSESQKFICDFMLGRLAKWMRLLGFDTLYHRDTDEVGILHQARKEKRMILTRSRALAEYENAILIKSEQLDEQMEQIKELSPIKTPFTRCPECNSKIECVDKEEIREDVPEYIYKVHNNFKKCPCCGRIFWKGSHYKEIKRKIDEITK